MPQNTENTKKKPVSGGGIRIVPLAWYQSAWEEQQELLGPDPWSYGLTDINMKNLETMAGYVHQQGMTGKLMPLEELFPQEAFGWSTDPSSGL